MDQVDLSCPADDAIPDCVSPALRALSTMLNDEPWSSPQARANGLRRLAIAQLGSRDALSDEDFAARVVDLVTRKHVPEALRAAAHAHPAPRHRRSLIDAAQRCEREDGKNAAIAALVTAMDDARLAGLVAAMDDARLAADWGAAWAAARAAEDAILAATALAAEDAVRAATRASAWGADADALDVSRAAYAEDVVQILIGMSAPGCAGLAREGAKR